MIVVIMIIKKKSFPIFFSHNFFFFSVLISYFSFPSSSFLLLRSYLISSIHSTFFPLFSHFPPIPSSLFSPSFFLLLSFNFPFLFLISFFVIISSSSLLLHFRALTPSTYQRQDAHSIFFLSSPFFSSSSLSFPRLSSSIYSLPPFSFCFFLFFSLIFIGQYPFLLYIFLSSTSLSSSILSLLRLSILNLSPHPGQVTDNTNFIHSPYHHPPSLSSSIFLSSPLFCIFLHPHHYHPSPPPLSLSLLHLPILKLGFICLFLQLLHLLSASE